MGLTYEELLTKVNELDYIISTEPSGDKAVYALRAVVELHKPEVHPNPDYITCTVCFDNEEFEYEYIASDWPCPTIQVIEKELG